MTRDIFVQLVLPLAGSQRRLRRGARKKVYIRNGSELGRRLALNLHCVVLYMGGLSESEITMWQVEQFCF